MKHRMILMVGVLCLLLVNGCGGSGGDSVNIIGRYIGVWQGPILPPPNDFDWRLTFADGGTDLDGNPIYSYEVWDLEPGVEFMWGAGYAVAFPTGLVDFTALHPNTGNQTFRFTGYISGNAFTGSMFSFGSGDTHDFVLTRQ